eukprot:6205802-Pleurochrysis_carterae.AAC.2
MLLPSPHRQPLKRKKCPLHNHSIMTSLGLSGARHAQRVVAHHGAWLAISERSPHLSCRGNRAQLQISGIRPAQKCGKHHCEYNYAAVKKGTDA